MSSTVFAVDWKLQRDKQEQVNQNWYLRKLKLYGVGGESNLKQCVQGCNYI